MIALLLISKRSYQRILLQMKLTSQLLIPVPFGYLFSGLAHRTLFAQLIELLLLNAQYAMLVLQTLLLLQLR